MYLEKFKKGTSGFSLIEVIVVISLTALIFGALFVSFEYSLKLIAQSRAKMTALSLSTDRVEYLRSLPYNSVGTVSGIPNGNIPQNRVVSLNGIDFNERVLIEYVDDPSDGIGGADSNSIVADYKKIKIEYTWNIYDTPQSFSLISNVVPRSIETTAGGGTLRVNVFDASVAPLQGIDVRLLNTTTTSTVDVTRKTDATGTAYFTGAPAASGYQIFVSAPGYSSDQTRLATTSLPNPITLPVAVLESDVSTMNFQIDRLSDLTVNVFDGQTIDSVTENFDDLLGTADNSNVIASGTLSLVSVAGVYEVAGSVMLNPITPATIESWGTAEIDYTAPASTDVRVRFYSSTSTASLISESNLPGNLVGFSARFIDLSGLDLSTYPSLVVGIDLTTTDTSVAPEVNSVNVSHIESRNHLSLTTLSLHGSKVIGTDSGAALVYKNIISTTTDVAGQVVLSDIEWDSYIFSLGGGLVIKEACAGNPLSLSPDTQTTLNILAGATTANNLRLAVKAGDGTPIVDAAVELRDGGSTWNAQTSWCGQVYFGGLSSGSDYEIEVSATGYTTQTISSTTISGVTVQEVTLLP
jgi:type II secretory pathway pseudopilin PulG